MLILRTYRTFFIFLILLGYSCVSYANDEAPAPVRRINFPKKGSFYLTLMSPYPASFGVGITHYFFESLGLVLEFGKGNEVVTAAGLKFRPAAMKFSPVIGFIVSRGSEPGASGGGGGGETSTASAFAAAEGGGDSAASKVFPLRGFGYATTGVDWKWDMGILVHVGINWVLTPVGGITQMKPFLQVGFPY